MSTRKSIAEQILLRLKGGRPDAATKTDIRDIILAVGQQINKMAGQNYYNTTLPTGETIPDAGMMFPFEDVPVVAWKNTSRCILPAYPIHLPRGMGVFSISTPGNPLTLFIPALPGQMALLESQSMISSVFDAVVYEWFGNSIMFNRNILLENITAVTILLVVSDVSQLSDTDTLPIPANYEADIISELYREFAGQLPADEKTDVLTDKTSGK